MSHQDWLTQQAHVTLSRLLPRLEPVFTHEDDQRHFFNRLQREFPRLFGLLYHLYGQQYDFFYHVEQILRTAAESYQRRSESLKQLDHTREANPHWFQSEKLVGGVCYVDLFAGDLNGLREKLPYIQELGLTYLHLMPLFKSPEDNSDGGYAVSDYRRVNPSLGTMRQLAELADDLREKGISLVLDFVFNHTSDRHGWAQRALAGDEQFQRYYRMFPDRTTPDRYEQTLREIFPEQSPGNFTYRPEINKWVWTSFYSFQWDLNYANPDVFDAMLGEMLFLANQGVEVLRLDAVAFLWKEMGTVCENLPEAHMIIQAYNALVRVAAPAMTFKSEAIVHPKDVASYISRDECPLSYNPTLMALSWEALATRDVSLLQHSMARRFTVPDDCAWVNYIRVHDDIGWTFANEDAAELHINGYDHRQFLNQFYIGKFEGSFATGVPFGYNPRTGDMRISGTAASLAGLEQAVNEDDPAKVADALGRLLLLHSLILSAGGIPLIYLNDEIATLNDYSYLQDPDKQDDSRWVHRPEFDWQRAANRHDAETIPGRMFQGLQRLIEVRQSTPELGRGKTTFFDTGNRRVLGFLRSTRVLVLMNFTEATQTVARERLNMYTPADDTAHDLLTDEPVTLPEQIELAAYDFVWWRV